MAEKDTTDATKAAEKAEAPDSREDSTAKAPAKEPVTKKAAAPKKKSTVKKKASPRKKAVKKAAPAAAGTAAGTATGAASKPAAAAAEKPPAPPAGSKPAPSGSGKPTPAAAAKKPAPTSGAKPAATTAAKPAAAATAATSQPAASASPPRKAAPAKPVSTKSGLLPWVVLASAIAGAAYLYDQPRNSGATGDDSAAGPAGPAATSEPSDVVKAGRNEPPAEPTIAPAAEPLIEEVTQSVEEVRQPAPVSPGDAPPVTDPEVAGQDSATEDGVPVSGQAADHSAALAETPAAEGGTTPEHTAATAPSAADTGEAAPLDTPEGAAPEESEVSSGSEGATAPADRREAMREEMRKARERMMSGQGRPPAPSGGYPYQNYQRRWAPQYGYPAPYYGTGARSQTP